MHAFIKDDTYALFLKHSLDMVDISSLSALPVLCVIILLREPPLWTT